MQAQRAAITEGRAVTLRSAHLPQRMAAAVAVLVRVLLCQVRGGAEAASVRRVRQHLRQQRTAAVVAAMAVLRLVSAP